MWSPRPDVRIEVRRGRGSRPPPEPGTAIFDYQRRRSPSESWQATFASIFDISVEDFYTAFEAYRVALAAPPPQKAYRATLR